MPSHAINIYQIGDLATWDIVNLSSWHGEQHKARFKNVDLLYSRRRAFSYTPRLTELKNYRLTGTAYSTSKLMVREQIEELKRMIGVETDIVAFTIADCCPDKDCCGCNGFSYDIVWLTGRGTITELRADETDYSHTLILNVAMATPWKAMNRAVWEWREGKAIWRRETAPANRLLTLRPYPFVRDVFGDDAGHMCSNYFFVKREYQEEWVLMEPEIWPVYHDYHRFDFPQTGFYSDWHESSLNPIWRNVVSMSAQRLWSLEPSTYYVFEADNTSDVIQVQVERFIGNNLWKTDTQQSVLDLAELNTEMNAAGLGNLLPTDRIIMGDLDQNAPGAVIRAGARLPVYVPATFEGEYFGALGVERSKVTVTLPPDTRFAMRADFQTL